MTKKLPKYKLIAERLKTEINNGTYAPGERLPYERLLAEQFEVSRMTIRQSIKLLEEENFVKIIPDRGAVVIDHKIQRNREIKSLTELLRDQGLEHRNEVIRIEKGKPTKKLKELLLLTDNDQVYYLDRIRYADEDVVAIEYTAINAKICPGLEMFNFEDFSLYDVLFKHYHVSVSYAKDDITADFIEGEQARIILNQEKGPALIVNNTTYNDTNLPIEYTKTIYHYQKFTYTVYSSEGQ